MRILDRYILKSIIFGFLATMMVFSLLFILIDSASNLDEFLDRKVTIEILARYYMYYLPTVMVQTASIACLIAALLTYSNLNSHNEIIVLRASGMNFWQITRPALCVAFLVASLVFMINERYIPYAQEKVNQIKNENLILEVDRKKKKKAKIHNMTFYGMKSRLYFIDSFDPNTYELEGVTIIGYNKQQEIEEKIVALKGVWTGIAWKFYQCQVTLFSDAPDVPTTVKVYQEKLVDIKETPNDFLKQNLDVQVMNIRQLADYISRFTDSGARRALNNLRVDLYQKTAFPLSTIVIILLGLPLAIMTQRRKAQTFTSLGIAVAIGFFYYVSNAVGLALGKGGLFPPLLAAWLAPLIFGAGAISVIRSKF